MSILTGLIAGALLALAILMGGADALALQNSPDSLDRALHIERSLPGGANAAHLERLSSTLAGRRALTEAVRVNPRASSAWIELGFREESTRNFEGAAQAFLHAARIDRHYLPAWTLTNFYFRRDNQSAFWPWAARAASRTFDDFRPIFALADRFERDPSTVLDRLGTDARVERAYLQFLIEAKRLDAAAMVARKLIARRDPADQSRLAEFITREIRADRSQEALGLWNAGFPALDPHRGPVLSNGDLSHPPAGEGFDWYLVPSRGVRAEWFSQELSLSLDGSQPDAAVVLEQPIPLARGVRYRFQAEHLGTPTSLLAGQFVWEVASSPVVTPMPAAGWTNSESTWTSAATHVTFLRLVYRRSPGTLPLQGDLRIRKIRLDVL